jgi:hypothetical protein
VQGYVGTDAMENLRLASGVTMQRFHDRRDLLANFDTIRRDLDSRGTLAGLDGLACRAFDMVTSGVVRRALDVSREDPRTRDRYQGVEKFLIARRLVEAGVGCVSLSHGTWDTHEKNFISLRRWLPEIDRGLAALVSDLCDRGMDKDVVTVMWGEFGRAPKIGDVTPDGRSHWPLMSAVVAGGGLKMGQAIGSTSARAEYARDRPYRVPQVLATLYQAIGIDPATTFPNASGRPIHVLDDREPVTELL